MVFVVATWVRTKSMVPTLGAILLGAVVIWGVNNFDMLENQVNEDASRQTKNPEEELLENVLDEDVQLALDKLPPDYRMVVILADLEGFSYKEIAEILEVPVGTVMSRLYRGRRLLEAAMLEFARDHGYLRDGEPAKMRSKVATTSK